MTVTVDVNTVKVTDFFYTMHFMTFLTRVNI